MTRARNRAARTASSDATTASSDTTTSVSGAPSAWLVSGAVLVALLALFAARRGPGAAVRDAPARGPSLASLDAPPPLDCPADASALLLGARTRQAAFEDAVTALPMEVGRARCLLALGSGLDLAKPYPTRGGRGRGGADAKLFPRGALLLTLVLGHVLYDEAPAARAPGARASSAAASWALVEELVARGAPADILLDFDASVATPLTVALHNLQLGVARALREHGAWLAPVDESASGDPSAPPLALAPAVAALEHGDVHLSRVARLLLDVAGRRTLDAAALDGANLAGRRAGYLELGCFLGDATAARAAVASPRKQPSSR